MIDCDENFYFVLLYSIASMFTLNFKQDSICWILRKVIKLNFWKKHIEYIWMGRLYLCFYWLLLLNYL